MRRVALILIALLTVAVASSGCDSWWYEKGVHQYNSPSVYMSNEGESACTITLPANQTSGWYYEYIPAIYSYSNVSIITVQSRMNGWWMVAPLGSHYVYTKNLYQVGGSTTQGSAGKQRIAGIFPGEWFHMSYYASATFVDVDMYGHIEDASGNILSTESTCALAA